MEKSLAVVPMAHVLDILRTILVLIAERLFPAVLVTLVFIDIQLQIISTRALYSKVTITESIIFYTIFISLKLVMKNKCFYILELFKSIVIK